MCCFIFLFTHSNVIPKQVLLFPRSKFYQGSLSMTISATFVGGLQFWEGGAGKGKNCLRMVHAGAILSVHLISWEFYWSKNLNLYFEKVIETLLIWYILCILFSFWYSMLILSFLDCSLQVIYSSLILM